MRVAPKEDRRLGLHNPGDAVYEPKGNTLRIQCAGETQLLASVVKGENKNALKIKEWWNGIPLSWLENGIVKLGLTM